MQKKLVVGNWKMNPKKREEAESILKAVEVLAKEAKYADIVVCVPFVYLSLANKLALKKTHLGAQDVSQDTEGAHTGEVSSSMLTSLKASHVIVGHSERRSRGDTNEIVNQKIRNALKAKLIPIVCIGESVRDTHGFYLAFIKQQLHECLALVLKSQMKNIVIAYEPLWAIGSDAVREATPEEFTEIQIFIRKILSDMYDVKTAHAMQILYGGSVHPQNAASFIHASADGFLVGRDSLTPRTFARIIAVTH